MTLLNHLIIKDKIPKNEKHSECFSFLGILSLIINIESIFIFGRLIITMQVVQDSFL